MAEYSRIAKGHFTSNGSAQVVNLPFQPDSVQLWNYTAYNSAATSQNILNAYWDVSMGQGQAFVEGYNATPALIGDVVPLNGISTFAAGQLLQYGPVYKHTGSTDFSMTAANPTVVTTTTAHGLQTGNVVVFSNLYQTSTTGMQQIAGIPFTVTVTSSTAFSIDADTSNTATGFYTAFNTSTSTGNVGSWKQVLYPYLYAPGQAFITDINIAANDHFTGPANTIKTAAAHNFSIGQEVAFRIPQTFGSTQLNSLPDVLIPGSPIYWYVSAVTQNTFTVSQSSNGVQGLSSVTEFVPSQLFSSFPGLKFPQVVAAGDVNTGGQQIYAGSPLYPSPLLYNGSGTAQVPTINGPAINSAFVNNTSQGFIVGGGAGRVLTTASLVGANTNIVYWKAYLSDLAVN